MGRTIGVWLGGLEGEERWRGGQGGALALDPTAQKKAVTQRERQEESNATFKKMQVTKYPLI
jgi:hypothetical protein